MRRRLRPPRWRPPLRARARDPRRRRGRERRAPSPDSSSRRRGVPARRRIPRRRKRPYTWRTSRRDQVACGENGRESGSHERDGRRDRARRRPRDAAYAVAAGASSAVARADSHQQPRRHERGETRVDPDLRQRGEETPGERRGDQAGDKGDAPVDIVARTLADQVSKSLGQPVLVENRPGASSLVGTQFVARSAPDGYTVLAVANTFATVPLIVASPGYDPLKDFTGITLTCLVPQVLVVNPALPAQSVKELVALAKSQPGKISYASSGNGSTGHMAAELFNRQAGVTMLHVPYKGNSQALVDVISGQVAMMFDQVSTSTPQIKAGKVRAIAVTSQIGRASCRE